MAVCPECGRHLDKDATYCKYCGADLEVKDWNAKEVLYYYGPFQEE